MAEKIVSYFSYQYNFWLLFVKIFLNARDDQKLMNNGQWIIIFVSL
ncbi:hypothetical protein [Okeania sp. SIO2B3]|nr:hypothetical protein [Okeania sp. SIO2B3]NET42561.1 hypothetical protein [Okeania sp. SIO2B3]